MTVNDSDRYFRISVQDRKISLQFLSSVLLLNLEYTEYLTFLQLLCLAKSYFVKFDTIIFILFLLISITYDNMFIQ